MYHFTDHLWRTMDFIRTEMKRLAFFLYQLRIALWTAGYIVNLRGHCFPFFGIYAYYFRNDFTAFFYIYKIIFVQIQFLDNILIMKRCPFHNSSRQKHWRQIGNWRDYSRSTNLIINRQKLSFYFFSLEFMSCRPAW